MKHKYDRRGANLEGRFAENLFKEVCELHKKSFRTSNMKEDCSGVDGYLDGRPIDVKARKNRIPSNTCWMEVSKAGGVVGTGWAYHDKHIAQLMVYEENGCFIKAQFGIYRTTEAVKLMEKKVDFKSKANCGVLYELYTRWTDGEHRGTMTVLDYFDLESLKSFKVLEIPAKMQDRVKSFYDY